MGKRTGSTGEVRLNITSHITSEDGHWARPSTFDEIEPDISIGTMQAQNYRLQAVRQGRMRLAEVSCTNAITRLNLHVNRNSDLAVDHANGFLLQIHVKICEIDCCSL